MQRAGFRVGIALLGALASDAQSDAIVSTLAFAIGGAALATGVVLWRTAPSDGSVHVAPAVGLSSGGAVLAGAF